MASAANSLPENQPRRVQLSLLPDGDPEEIKAPGVHSAGAPEADAQRAAAGLPPLVMPTWEHDTLADAQRAARGSKRKAKAPVEPPPPADPVAEALAELQRTDAIGLELAAAAGGQLTNTACRAAGLDISWRRSRWHEIKDLEPAALAINQWARATELAEFRTNGTVPKVQRVEQEAALDDAELSPASAAPVAPGLSEEQLAYLRERGIPAETAQELYRRENSDLLIPYYGPTGDAYVIRSKEPKHDGKPYIVRRPFPKQTPKFLTPAAGGNRPYFSRLMPDGALERMDWPVVFVEGPIKCDALWCQIPEGFVFVALSGTWNWQDKRGADGIWRRENEETRVLPELRDIPMAGRVVTTLFDSDISDNNNVYRAAKMLRAWAQQRGARPHEVLLPNEPDGSKNGPDDYLERHGAEALVQLLQSAEPTGWPLSGPMLTPEGELRNDYSPSEQKRLIRELGQIQDISVRDTTIRSLASRLRWKFSEIIAAIEDTAEGDSMDDNFFIGAEQFEDSGNIDSRWIVPNLLPRGEVIVLTALSGLGKSLLVYELLYAVATGGEFLGFPVQKGKVLILQLEEGKSSWTTRLKAKGFTALGNPGPGQPWALNTNFDLAKPRHVEILKGVIQQVDVVMIDSARAVGRSFDIDENHADFGKRIIRPLARLFNGSDASGIIIHHNAKGTGKAAGTEDIIAAVWGVFNLKAAPGASKGEEGAPNEFHLISDKGRDTDAIKWHLRRERTDGVDESGNGWQYELLAELQYMAPDLTLRDRVFVVLKGAAGPVSLREIAQELAMPDDHDGKVNTSLRSAAARDPGIRRWRIEQKGPRGEALYQLPDGFKRSESPKRAISGTERHPSVKTEQPATRECSSSISGLYQVAKRTESNQGLQKEQKMEGGVCVPPEQGGKKAPAQPKPRKPRAVKDALAEATLALALPPPADELVPADHTGPLLFDLETRSVDELFDPVEPGGRPFITLVGTPYGQNTDPSALVEYVKAGGTLVAHNGFGFDFLALAIHHGLDLLAAGDNGQLIDTMVLAMLREHRIFTPVKEKDIGENFKRNWSLDSLAKRYAGVGKTDDIKGLAIAAAKAAGHSSRSQPTLVKIGLSLIDPGSPELQDYLRGDIAALQAIADHYRIGELSSYEQREMRVQARLTYGVCLQGIRVDEALVDQRIAEMEVEAEAGRQWLASQGFSLVNEKGVFLQRPLGNPANKELLGKKLKALGVRKVPKTGKGAISTGKEGLGPLLQQAKADDNHELVRLLETVLMLSGQAHIYGTLREALNNGVVHPSISTPQASGRCSITKPAMTVFGKRGDHLLAQRATILPDSDADVLWACDLCQIDMRAMAVHSQDPNYLGLFRPGLDPTTGKPYDAHQGIADRIGVTRSNAKRVGHGWNYGMEYNTMVEREGVEPQLATSFIRGMEREFRRLVSWKAIPRSQGERNHNRLDNGFGRPMQCNPRRAHTMAPSLMGQGTARDLMMECILRLPAEIAGMLRIQVHDELVFSLPRDRAQELADQIQDLMTFQWAPRPEMQPVWVLNSSTQFGNNWAGCYQGQERLRLVDETTGERFWFWKE